MMTLRLEFVHESERIALITYLQNSYTIIEEGKVTPSRKQNSKRKIQFIEIEEKQ